MAHAPGPVVDPTWKLANMALQTDDDARRRSTISGERPQNLVKLDSQLGTVAETKPGDDNVREEKPNANSEDHDEDELPPLLEPEREQEQCAASAEQQPAAGDNSSEITLVGEPMETTEHGVVENEEKQNSKPNCNFSLAVADWHRRRPPVQN
jgi:hypothetical protein